MKCENCGATLQYAVDVLGVQQGVLGPRGFIDVAERVLFCSERCVAEYYSDPLEEERIP